jgi:hypothetical protein
MESDAPTPKERKMAFDQIVITTKITIGVTLIAIGVSIHLTSLAYINVNWSLFYGLVGAFVGYVAIGVLLLRGGLKQAKKDYGDLTKETPKKGQ